MRIAIQGELGSFSHEAALRITEDVMMRDPMIVPCALSADVFRMIDDRSVDAAVIPIENSLAGPVAEHYDLLLNRSVIIEREALLRIRHNLIALPGVALESINSVCSHPVALAQCRRFFNEHPDIHAVPYYDTAGSVRHLIETGDEKSGAIASRQAASQYGAIVLLADIEDNPANFTRFFFIRSQELVERDPMSDKVSLAFTVENRPGSLVAALQTFADLSANMTKIESRPVVGKPWQYVFYVDYQVSSADSANAVLHALHSKCLTVKELGRYRSAGQEPIG
jgi:prephenate dehydratase